MGDSQHQLHSNLMLFNTTDPGKTRSSPIAMAAGITTLPGEFELVDDYHQNLEGVQTAI